MRAIVADWKPMRSRLLEVAKGLESRKLPVDEAARKEAKERKAKAAASDVFRNEPADLAAARAERDAAGVGTKGTVAAGEDGNQVAA